MRKAAAIALCLAAAPAAAESMTCVAVASCVASTACEPGKSVAYDVAVSDRLVTFRDALDATEFELIRLPARPDMTLEAFRGGIGPDQGVVTLSVFSEMNFVLNIAVVIRNDTGAEVIGNAVSLIGKCARGA